MIPLWISNLMPCREEDTVIFYVVLISSIVFTLIILAAMLIISKTLSKELANKLLSYLLKGMAVLFFIVVVTRSIFYDTFIRVINGGWLDGAYIEKTDITHSIIRWGHSIASVAIPMAAFFRSRLFKNISIFICLPFAIVSLLNFDSFIGYFTAADGRGVVMPISFREFFLALDFFLAISFPLILLVCDRHFINLKDKNEILRFLIVLPFVIIRSCPVNVPQSIFGSEGMSFGAMSLGNIMWIALLATEVIVLNRIFRFKEYRERYMLCMFLALIGFVEYNSMTMMGFTIRRLPLQLCNLGTYFFLIALLIKNEKFFNFVFLANITGAIIAIVSPDAEEGVLTSFWGFHYFVEHTLVLIIPLMCNLLRIFPRLTKARALKHLTIGFACYFGFCFIFGTILNGITDITKQPLVNFFYIFDVAKVNQYLPFLTPLTKEVVLFKRFIIYPLFQISVFAIFWSLCVMLYFVLQKFYEILDDHLELRLARIKLYEKLTNKKSKAIIEFPN